MRPRHRNSFRKLCRLALQNISRNLLLSIATTVMMGLILFIFNVILALNVLTQSSLAELQSKVDLVIYVSDDISFYEVSEVIGQLEALEEVEVVSYTSKEEALESFLELYPDKKDPFTEFGIENPLPGNLQIITESPTQHGKIVNFLRDSVFSEYILDIESADENQEIVARLLRVTDFTQKLIVGVTVTFIFGSILMIMNAIHLSIFTRKREIQIMQLVGARPSMIRFPFLFEGAIYGLLSVFFSFALLIVFLEGTKLADLNTFKTSFDAASIIGVELVASVVIGVLSSLLAINYYLKRSFVLKA